jgi:hypothetical protein
VSYALPHPQRSIAIPLAALAIGITGGVAAQALLDDETLVFRSAPALVSSDLPSTSTPVPERVSPAPAVVAGSLAGTTSPVPERVSPTPAADTGGTPAPVPERVSGVRAR